MKNILLSPLVAFLIYFVVVSITSGLGRLFSATGRKSEFKTDTYASGEEHDPLPAAPGYRQFFVIALFFAVLHLGVSEDYCTGGMNERAGLLLHLVGQVRRSSRRVKGVRRLEVLYGGQRLRPSTC